MANPTVTFNFESSEITLQCLKTETMRMIIQRFRTKIQQSADSFMYLYNGDQVNLDLTFEQQANHLDRENNQMKILVYKTESNGFKCPYCGVKIKLDVDLDDIIKSFNNLKETINGIKLMLENIIKTSANNPINSQLKVINISLNSINEDIKKNNEKLEKILNNNSNNNDEFQNKNIIKGIIEINSNDINKNIILFNTEMNKNIDIYINNWKINVIKENKKRKYNFNKTGKYMFEFIFNDNITNCRCFFNKCSNIISLDLTNFDTSNVIDMSFMFSNCNKLKEIKGINKFITNNVTAMNSMFQECNEIDYLDLTNFDTSNITKMNHMFNKCHKLKKIKGINKFITNKVIDMNSMFQECNEIEYLELTNFDTSNVTDMSFMFNQCHKLKEIKGINQFITKKVTNMRTMFQKCYEIEYLDLTNFNTSNVSKMNHMFCECHKLKEIKGINKFITNKVISMRTMFQKCYELQYLDLTNFNTFNVTDMSFMFFGCNKLKYLNVSNFIINCETEDMLSFDKKECKFIANDKKLIQLYYSS